METAKPRKPSRWLQISASGSNIAPTDDVLGWVLELEGKKEDLAYQKRKIWVDKERFLPLREELFAKSGKLIKTLKITDVFKVEDRWYPKKMIFKDEMKKGKGTEFIIDEIEFNAEIPAIKFSKASLRK